MCGFVGYISNSAIEDRERFELAVDVLAHRGPDDRGILQNENVLLGHRRLAIIDLSRAGRQPMVDEESGAAIVFNGEIYNYIELRRDLEELGCRFKTATDTETLLKAYLTWGPDCLGRLNGMWAFAIWLPRQRRLFFARDRFGIKPFYYHYARQYFSVASEPKSLLAMFPKCREVNRSALRDFFVRGLLYASDASFYKGISVLPPAHCGEYTLLSAKPRLWRYWKYPDMTVESFDSDVEGQVEEFSSLLNDAVRIRLRSDVPVGVTLSGGLDSSAVLAGCRHMKDEKTACFTSVYSAQDRGEAHWARLACKPYGIRLIEVESPPDSWLDTLWKVVWHMDGPGYSPAVYPLWFLMKEARKQEVPVLLEGQGADEAFGGYPQYGILDFFQKWESAFRHLNTEAASELFSSLAGLVKTFTLKWTVLWLVREMWPDLLKGYRKKVGCLSVLRPEFLGIDNGERVRSEFGDCPENVDRLTSRLWQDHSRDILPGLLHYGDAISMAHSIESRLPYMDYRLVEWIFRRSSRFKLRAGETKWLIRDYLRKQGMTAIADRKDKKGYPTPADEWLRNEDGTIVRDFLLRPGAGLHEYCDPKRIEKLIDYHIQGGHGAGNHLYRLLTTELWLERCILTDS